MSYWIRCDGCQVRVEADAAGGDGELNGWVRCVDIQTAEARSVPTYHYHLCTTCMATALEGPPQGPQESTEGEPDQ